MTSAAVEREALGAEIAAMVEGDPETHGQFLAALNAATVFMPGRERTKTNNIKLVHELRMACTSSGIGGSPPAPSTSTTTSGS
jgi:hypothetical protein